MTRAVFSLVSKLCALQCGRECSGLFCGAAAARSETLSVGQVVQKGFWHGSRGGACGSYRKAFFSVVLYIFPTLIGIRFSFPQKRNCRFVICLLILASWRCFKSYTGKDFNLWCLKAAWKHLYSIPISYHSSNYCFFSCYPACKIRGVFWCFPPCGFKIAFFFINTSCFRQLPFGRDQCHANKSTPI